MKSLFIITVLLASFSVVYSETIPFLNVYMKSYNNVTKQIISYYWGPSGNITFSLDLAKPNQSIIDVSLFETNKFFLNGTQVESIKNFVNYRKINDFVILEFPATQIALSEYDSNNCGLFSDIEYTFDIDMPLNPIGKDESSNLRFEFSFLFDLTYQETLEERYNFLEAICKQRIKRHSVLIHY